MNVHKDDLFFVNVVFTTKKFVCWNLFRRFFKKVLLMLHILLFFVNSVHIVKKIYENEKNI